MAPTVKRAKKTGSAAPYLTIVLPVYNEEENIELQYQRITEAVDPLKKTYEIIFVDDGSRDRSPELLRELARKDKRVKVVFFRRNFGQTGAMAAGVHYSSGDIVVFMDSDLQNEPNDIGKLIDRINEGYDVVSGWRVERKDKLLSRKIPSRIANRLIARVTGVPLHDLGCSLKAYRGDLIRKVNLYGEMHRFIPVHTSWIGARITEVPVGHHARQFGKSKYGIKRTFKVILDLMTVKFMGSFFTKPMHMFGGTGLILLLCSMISGITVICMKLFLHMNMIRNPLLLLTVMFIILSVLFIQIGILAEIMIRIYHESQNKLPFHVRETLNISERK